MRRQANFQPAGLGWAHLRRRRHGNTQENGAAGKVPGRRAVSCQPLILAPVCLVLNVPAVTAVSFTVACCGCYVVVGAMFVWCVVVGAVC